MTTFPQVLARLLAADPGRPLVTFYDDATGERTELSVATWATWVAKVSSLLTDELDVEHGSRLLVDLPAHWLGTVVLGAAWACGIEVVWDGEADAVVTGPGTLGRWAPEAGRIPVVATALLPLAGPFADGVPAEVHDLGLEVWSQPDAYVAYPAPADHDLAVAGTTQAELWAVGSPDRLLSEANPASRAGLPCLTVPLAGGGSLVLVRNAAPERVGRVAMLERATTAPHPRRPG
ncbi:MAG TPA: TIGR03089 family protein [Nocardioides sp.]|jgi:uncharacterized protein (TIGR03089 family)|uniref:TIGR03089 family protein n=1 Tax=Nocardioides sp. TaxID=35761 RepID=UPI002E31F3BE|nr:TIGR03089 family protein [Nocardioides sp.]HEX3929300.1 TIGR03089 family protein [Nocardioides sp.]